MPRRRESAGTWLVGHVRQCHSREWPSGPHLSVALTGRMNRPKRWNSTRLGPAPVTHRQRKGGARNLNGPRRWRKLGWTPRAGHAMARSERHSRAGADIRRNTSSPALRRRAHATHLSRQTRPPPGRAVSRNVADRRVTRAKKAPRAHWVLGSGDPSTQSVKPQHDRETGAAQSDIWAKQSAFSRVRFVFSTTTE